MSLPRSYLESSLRPIVGPAAVDGVTEYLLSCDPENQRPEMVSFLEESWGRNPKFSSIIKQYSLMSKNLGKADGKQAGLSAMEAPKSKKKKKPSEAASAIGGARVVNSGSCGCMATKHPLWGNCTSCGRIYCVEEVVAKCKYCDQDVLAAMSAEDAIARSLPQGTINAYRHKDKLMMFDSENTKRTQVHDAQSDYYVSSNWLSDEEKKEMERKEKLRYDSKFERKSTFNISLDITGRRIIQSVDADLKLPSSAEGGPFISSSSLENRDLASKSSGRAGEVYRDLRSRICSMSIGPEAVSSSASNFAVDRPIDFLNSGNFKTLSCGEPSGGINKL